MMSKTDFSNTMSFVLDESIGLLQKNFVFNSSLGSKESFLSGQLAMLLLQDNSCDKLLKDIAQELAKFFKPTKPPKNKDKKKYRLISVFKEFHTFDLLIAYVDEDSYEQIKRLNNGDAILDILHNATDTQTLKALEEGVESSQWKDALKILKQKAQFVVIENKFKTLPCNEQLAEQLGKINRTIPYISAGQNSVKIHFKNTTCYLLSTRYPAKDLPDILPYWKQVYYAHIATKLNDIIEAHSSNESNSSVKYLREYYEVLRFHIWISIEITKSIEHYKHIFPEKLFQEKLDKIHLLDFYEKAWFSKLVYFLGDLLPSSEDVKVIKEADFTKGHGLVGYKCVMHNGSRIAYGVQMQNRQFRFYVEPQPTKYYRAVELDEKLRQGHLPNHRKKTYHWTHFSEDLFYKALDKVRQASLKALKNNSFIESASNNLSKFDDFKYVYVELSEDTTQEELKELFKVALVKLSKTIQKNPDLFKVYSNSDINRFPLEA